MDHRNARLTFLARIDLIREVEAGLFACGSGPALPRLPVHGGRVGAVLPGARNGRTGRQLLPAPSLPTSDRCGARRPHLCHAPFQQLGTPSDRLGPGARRIEHAP